VSAAKKPYDDIARQVTSEGERPARMRIVVDRLWEALSDSGVSWVGFYLHEGADELVLGPMRDKPACSPIGMHGVCGQAFLAREAMVVEDVSTLGESFIACDPRDRSEVVVPCFDEEGRCWGVLDLDSHETGAFGDDDAVGLCKVLAAAGLSQSD
jgi:putative methionine-R-sulfoxide reductase with GAF domain